jgi:cytochrome c oxidase assembly protein subunit 15
MNGLATRPVSWGLHAWTVLTAGATLVLLALGQLVTSFQAGMADPIWPTEPWYLLAIGWKEPSRGYLIEHTHRIAAFTVGGLVSVLALWLWGTDPDRLTRRLGLVSLVVLLAGFGQFHGGLIAQRNVATNEVRCPIGGTAVTLIGLTGILALAVAGLVRRSDKSGLRFTGVLALVGVMIQGLFGGFRVMLNELIGTDLATIHGIFAQVVFCLLISIAVLTGRPSSSELPESHARRLTRRSVILTTFVFIQVVLGALVRHSPTPLSQRLHFLTAFLATALAVWMLTAIFSLPAARERTRLAGWLLGLLLIVQIILGVEAWMAKFGSYTLPELVTITVQYATIRTSHALVGSGLLATALVITLRLGRPSGIPISKSETTVLGWREPAVHAEEDAAVLARFRGTSP